MPDWTPGCYGKWPLTSMFASLRHGVVLGLNHVHLPKCYGVHCTERSGYFAPVSDPLLKRTANKGYCRRHSIGDWYDGEQPLWAGPFARKENNG
jgi:hypothetical protein